MQDDLNVGIFRLSNEMEYAYNESAPVFVRGMKLHCTRARAYKVMLAHYRWPSPLCDAPKIVVSTDDLAYSTEWLIDPIFFLYFQYIFIVIEQEDFGRLNSTIQRCFEHDLCGRLGKSRYRN